MRSFVLLFGLLALLALVAWLVSRSGAAPLSLEAQATDHEAAAAALESPAASGSRREAEALATPAPGNARVHGHVYFEGTRETVADAELQLSYLAPEAAGDSPPKPSTTRSDAQGAYAVELPSGARLREAHVLEREPRKTSGEWHELRVDAFAPTTRDLQLQVVRGDVELDLSVDPGIFVHGTVLEAGTDQPIAGAEVVLDNGEFQRFGTTSAADGQFTIRGITFRSNQPWTGKLAQLSAACDEHARAELTLPAPDAEQYWPEITLWLERGVVVGGIVEDAAGAPVSGLELGLRPLHGPPQEGLNELEGEWKTTSERDGIFRFQRIPAFDRAWLVTDRSRVTTIPGIVTRQRHGASRTLLRGKDPYLPSIELRLALEVGIEVDVRYPDGTLAGPKERLLLREESDGKLHTASEDELLFCPVGVATRIVAWGKARDGDEDGVAYRGETVATVGSLGADPRPEIHLLATKIERKAHDRSQRSMSFGAGSWIHSTIELQFVDRANGAQLPPESVFSLEQANGSITSQIGKDAIMRMDMEPGWVTMKICFAGYAARTIEIEVRDDEPQTLTLPLDRVR